MVAQGGGACVVAAGGCVWVLGGCVWLLRGWHVWLLWGGMRGCSGGVMHGCSGGACMVAPGGHVWLLVGGMHGCSCGFFDEIRSMSGWYASYWNAFLLNFASAPKDDSDIHRFSNKKWVLTTV